MAQELSQQTVELFVRRLAAKGRLVDSGWHGFKHTCIPADASPEQLHDMRMAFFSGASHLFAAISTMMDTTTDDTTDADMENMASVHRELATFAKELALHLVPPQGHV